MKVKELAVGKWYVLVNNIPVEVIELPVAGQRVKIRSRTGRVKMIGASALKSELQE